MRIGLFIPCFIDAFLPEVGIATLELLERFGNEVIYPRDQTCCGPRRTPRPDPGGKISTAGTGRSTSRVGWPQGGRAGSPGEAGRREVIQALGLLNQSNPTSGIVDGA